MLKLTETIKSWLRENKGVAEDADDATYTKTVADGICDGSITPQQVTEMTKDPDAEKANVLTKTLGSMQTAMEKMAEQIAVLSQKPAEAKARPVATNVTPSVISGGEAVPTNDEEVKVNVVTMDKMFSCGRSERTYPAFDGRGRKHPLAGQRMSEGGKESPRFIDNPSELDRAVVGAVTKHQLLAPLVARGLMPKGSITDLDRQLYEYAVREMPWGGEITKFGGGDTVNIRNRKLEPWEQKAVLDDGGGSGGLEVVPIVFDDAIITTPLLHSEFFPRVNVVNVPRGRRMEGGKIANPTWTWNTTEATAIVLETTTSFVTAFDTDIHTVSGAITMGLDFLSDSPVNVGDIVMQNFGQGLLNTLDDVIVDGDGTTQPDGILGTGTNIIACGSSWDAGDVVSLFFGIGKEYKQGTDKNRLCFGSNELTFSRLRAIATGVTGDTRFVFGMNIGDYTLADGYPWLINDSYGNAEASFTNLARYRIYRRLGLTSRIETDGQTLALSNLQLIVVRGRFGGQLEDFEASAYTTSGQA